MRGGWIRHLDLPERVAAAVSHPRLPSSLPVFKLATEIQMPDKKGFKVPHAAQLKLIRKADSKEYRKYQFFSIFEEWNRMRCLSEFLGI